MERFSSGGSDSSQLDELFRAYREACPDADPGVNFMPELWAKIEAREVSATWFSRMAGALVTAALAACVILGLMASSRNVQSNAYLTETYVEALQAEHASTLEPMSVERISYLEPQ
jgi:hypothetical protein